MSTPTHHLPEPLLAAFATGAASHPLDVLVATHLALCPHCRGKVDQLDALGGALLAVDPGLAPSPGFHEALMARLDEPAPPPEKPPLDPSGRLPAPLYALTGDLDAIRWSWAGPGLSTFDLAPRPVGLPLRLMRFAPGHVVPVHDHAGEERAVVLQGGWTDQNGHFGRGDWCQVARTERGHRQVIDEGQPCLALVLNDAPALAHNPVIRALAAFLRI